MAKKRQRKKDQKQAVAAGANSALLRAQPKESARPLRVLEAIAAAPKEGRRFKVVLIDQGVGNRRDLRCYGPEAMASAPRAFEGRAAFIDHPTATEDEDQPERSVRRKCGYYKGVHVETLTNPETGKSGPAVVGELHCDLSATGRFASEKLLTALHYQQEFSGQPADQYVGLSINAAGKSEEREMEVDGATETVEYVTEFIPSPLNSVDIVTVAGRGGRVLALVESAARSKRTKEAHMKKIEAALAALEEALTVEDPEKRKVAVAEAKKLVEAAKKSREADGEAEDDAEADGEADEAEEAEGKAKFGKQLAAFGRKLLDFASEMGYEDDAEADAESEDDAEDADAEDDTEAEDAQESKREAIEALIRESKVKRDLLPPVRLLMKLPIAEAKAEIQRYKRLIGAVAAESLRSLQSAGHGPKGVEAHSGAGSMQETFKVLED